MKLKKIIRALSFVAGSSFAMFLITLATDATTRSVLPLWHSEPEMPECLKAKIK